MLQKLGQLKKKSLNRKSFKIGRKSLNGKKVDLVVQYSVDEY